jgi:hypothetical protein
MGMGMGMLQGNGEGIVGPITWVLFVEVCVIGFYTYRQGW